MVLKYGINAHASRDAIKQSRCRFYLVLIITEITITLLILRDTLSKSMGQASLPDYHIVLYISTTFLTIGFGVWNM